MGRGVVVVLGGGPPPTHSSEAFSLPTEGAVPRASRGDRTVCLPRAGAERNEACFKDLSPVTREIRAQGNSTEGGGKWEDSGSVLKKTLGIGNGVEIKRRRGPPKLPPRAAKSEAAVTEAARSRAEAVWARARAGGDP